MAGRLRHMLGTAEAVVALAAGWVLVFAVPIRRTTAWFGGTTVPADRCSASPEQVQRAHAITRRVAHLAARVPWRTTCLVQALAGWLLLRRRRIAAVVRFGVAGRQTGIAAHAWLIVGDRTVLGGKIAPDFVPLADLGGGPP